MISLKNIMLLKTHLMLLAALGAVGAAFSEDCPSPEAISPCMCLKDNDRFTLFCHDEDMALDDLQKVLNVFDNQYALRLHLFYINLGTVPKDFFQGFNIVEISFANCKFEQIPDKEGRVLVGLEDTLKKVTVIQTIEKQNSPVVLDLSHLNRLTELDISSNTIPELSDNWFGKGPSSLTHLMVNDNRIEKLGDNAFAKLPNLEELWLVENQFGEVKRSMLPNPANHLKSMFLENNHLKTIPEDFFTEMPALTTLSLAYNDLTIISQETFEGIWGQLEFINVLGNDVLDCEDTTLKWIIDSSNLPEIFGGLCAKPTSRKGEHIYDVIKEIRKDNDPETEKY